MLTTRKTCVERKGVNEWHSTMTSVSDTEEMKYIFLILMHQSCLDLIQK
jgi:hypothetical protein